MQDYSNPSDILNKEDLKAEVSEGWYSYEKLDNDKMSEYANATCIGFQNEESHEQIILDSGWDNYDFHDPRPGQQGTIRAEKFFINQDNKEIQGINFSKDGDFCCSYTGMSYNDIKESNIMDYKKKQEENH